MSFHQGSVTSGSDEVEELTSNIRQALQETVTQLLSPDIDTRNLAEQQIKALEVTEEYGVHLTELTLDPHGPLGVRQMCALLLKQYVDAHWSPDSDKFQPPEAPAQAKATIRRMLPHGLKESISKVRSSVAYTISTIAHWDWPEQWPELFDLLMLALQDPNEFAVMGAVRVLKEFSRDLTDVQIPQVAPVILPDMYRIFMEVDAYGIRTRSRAIEIFTTFTNMICAIGEVNRSLSKSLLSPLLPTFTDALVTALKVPEDSHTTDPGLKTEVLKALTVLVRNVPKAMGPWLPEILPPVWSTLTNSAAKYVQSVVNEGSQGGGDGGGGVDDTEDELVDSDGEVLGFENLVFAIFEFVHALIETPKFRGAVKSGLADLVCCIVMYMQISDEQCEKWSENPDQFVEDEDENSFTYSVRVSSKDLLMALCEEFEKECTISLAQTLERHLAESETARMNGNPNWWKIHEAVMVCLGSCQELIEDQIKAGNVKFDIGLFLQKIVLSDIACTGSPFLLGRCLWIGGKFASRLNPETMKTFLEATVRGLQADQLVIVRIMAIRAVWGFCSHLRTHPEKEIYLSPVIPATLDALINMCNTYNSSSEIIGLVLENMPMVISSDPKITLIYESKITPLIIAIFLKYNSDPVVTSLSQDIFKVLSQTSGCLEPLQTRLVPTLVSILEADNQKVSPGLQSVALDVLQTLVRSSKSPLSDILMNSAFPAAIHCTLRTDDSAIMQSGGECLRSFVSTSPEQVTRFVDGCGEQKTGLWYLVQVAGHLLNPVGSEFAATFVGRLVTTLIQKTGDNLGSNLDLLLKAVLSKLQGSETLSVIQSLLMVYAQLIHSQLNAVLNFLSSVPGPTGETALNFVMTEWVSRQHLFYGAYENKVSITALAKLLQHGVNANDSRLQEIKVKGDLLNPSRQIRTRAQRKLEPDQWTQIDLLTKIFKLLIYEMSNSLSDVMVNDSDTDDEDEDEDDDDEDLGGQDGEGMEGMMEDENGASGGTELSRVIDLDLYDEEDDDEDPDALADPIYKLNLKQYLTEFLIEFSRQPYFGHFSQQTTLTERNALTAIGIQI